MASEIKSTLIRCIYCIKWTSRQLQSLLTEVQFGQLIIQMMLLYNVFNHCIFFLTSEHVNYFIIRSKSDLCENKQQVLMSQKNEF